jgi:hypothetical protein
MVSDRPSSIRNSRITPHALAAGAWPFSYPYGKASSFNRDTVAELARQDFTAAFSTERGVNRRGTSLYEIRRLDCKNATAEAGAIQGGTA